MAVDYRILGQRIRQARMAKHLTQEKLAEELDVSVAFLSRIERGTAHINLKRLNQVCKILNISEGELLNGTSSNSQSYLSKDFAELLSHCSTEQQRLIYNVAKAIAETKNLDDE